MCHGFTQVSHTHTHKNLLHILRKMFPSFVIGMVSIVASRRRKKKEDGKGTRPVVSREEVTGILKKYYGIEHSKIRDLDSYDDLNFRVETEDEFYVLKVFSSRRGDASMVIMENKAMEHVESNSKNVAIPRVISPTLIKRAWSRSFTSGSGDAVLRTSSDISSRYTLWSHERTRVGGFTRTTRTSLG